MVATLRVKRRLAVDGVGAPTSLANAELAYNEASHTLYYGEGTGGSGGTATSVVPIAGSGAFLPLNGGVLTTSLGSWSSANYGKQLLLTGSGNNPALGITDNAGANLVAVANAAGVLRVVGMPAYTNSTTAPVNLLSLSAAGNTSYTPTSFSSGVNFGSVVAPGGVTDLSRHIALYATTFGMSITSNRANYVVPATAAHVLTVGGVDKVTVNTAGLTMAAATDITLNRDPTTALMATTKQYTDAHAGVVAVSDTPPSGILPGALWWDSAGTGLYVSYNDGNSTQWVLTNSPSTSDVDVNSFNTRTGAVTLLLADVTGAGGAPIASPTFTGTVTLPADPALALQAATKQYADRVTATVATLAALRAMTAATLPNSDVQVRSYAGTGTKGGGRFVYVSTDTTGADNGGTIIIDASGRRWYRDGWQNEPVNVNWFGAVGDNTTDDTAAFNAAFNAIRIAGGALIIPAGNYRLTAAISVTLGTNAVISILGAGADITKLTWAAGGGLAINLPGLTNSAHVRDMTFCTGANGGATIGLALNLTIASVSFPNSPQSDVSNVSFMGSDGALLTHFWGTAIKVSALTQISFLNVLVLGHTDQGAYETTGIGLDLEATSSVPGVLYNFDSCTFNNLGTGINYGNWIQGVACVNCNFTGCGIGISAPPLTGEAQLSVTNCQFNCITGIYLSTPIFSVMVTTSLFLIPATGVGMQVTGEAQLNITANCFTSTLTSPTTGQGIVVAAGAQLGGTIVGNSFYNLPQPAINMAPGSGGFTISGNSFVTCPTPIADNGTGNVIDSNLGLPPIALDWAAQITASPWTHRAGSRPESLTLYSTGIINMVDIGGVFLLGGAVAANTNVYVLIPPWATVRITYSGTLTARGLLI
jgi:hypothetical protein